MVKLPALQMTNVFQRPADWTIHRIVCHHEDYMLVVPAEQGGGEWRR
jgi:hypothetical protein